MLLRYCVPLWPYLRYHACPATPAPFGQLLPVPLQPLHLHRHQDQYTATRSLMGGIGDVEARAAASEGPGDGGGPRSWADEQRTVALGPTVQAGDMVAREVTGSTIDLSVGQVRGLECRTVKSCEGWLSLFPSSPTRLHSLPYRNPRAAPY